MTGLCLKIVARDDFDIQNRMSALAGSLAVLQSSLTNFSTDYLLIHVIEAQIKIREQGKQGN